MSNTTKSDQTTPEQPVITNWATETEQQTQQATVADFDRVVVAKLETTEHLLSELHISDLLKVLIVRGETQSNIALSRGATKLLRQLHGEHLHSQPDDNFGTTDEQSSVTEFDRSTVTPLEGQVASSLSNDDLLKVLVTRGEDMLNIVLRLESLKILRKLHGELPHNQGVNLGEGSELSTSSAGNFNHGVATELEQRTVSDLHIDEVLKVLIVRGHTQSNFVLHDTATRLLRQLHGEVLYNRNLADRLKDVIPLNKMTRMANRRGRGSGTTGGRGRGSGTTGGRGRGRGLSRGQQATA